MAKDYSKLTVQQLKAELSQRELDTTGKKAELVARLTDQDDAAAAAEVPEDNGTGEEQTKTESPKDEPKQETVEKSMFDPEPDVPEEVAKVEPAVAEVEPAVVEVVPAVAEVVPAVAKVVPADSKATVSEHAKPAAADTKPKKVITEKVQPKVKTERTSSSLFEMDVSTTTSTGGLFEKDTSSEAAVKIKTEAAVKPKTDPVAVEKTGGDEKVDSSLTVKENKPKEVQATQQTSDAKKDDSSKETKMETDSEKKSKDKPELSEKQKKKNQAKKWPKIVGGNFENFRTELTEKGHGLKYGQMKNEFKSIAGRRQISAFPVTTEQLHLPVFLEIVEKSRTCTVHYHSHKNDGGEDVVRGLLHVHSKKDQYVEEILALLAKMGEDLKIYQSKDGDKREFLKDWNDKIRDDVIEKAIFGNSTVYVTNIPDAFTAKDFWEWFPTMNDFGILDGPPRRGFMSFDQVDDVRNAMAKEIIPSQTDKTYRLIKFFFVDDIHESSTSIRRGANFSTPSSTPGPSPSPRGNQPQNQGNKGSGNRQQQQQQQQRRGSVGSNQDNRRNSPRDRRPNNQRPRGVPSLMEQGLVGPPPAVFPAMQQTSEMQLQEQLQTIMLQPQLQQGLSREEQKGLQILNDMLSNADMATANPIEALTHALVEQPAFTPPKQQNQGRDNSRGGQRNQGNKGQGQRSQGQRQKDQRQGQRNQGQGQRNQGQGQRNQGNQGQRNQGNQGQRNQGQGQMNQGNQGQRNQGQGQMNQGNQGQRNQGQGQMNQGQRNQGQGQMNQGQRNQGQSPRHQGQGQKSPYRDQGYDRPEVASLMPTSGYDSLSSTKRSLSPGVSTGADHSNSKRRREGEWLPASEQFPAREQYPTAQSYSNSGYAERGYDSKAGSSYYQQAVSPPRFSNTGDRYEYQEPMGEESYRTAAPVERPQPIQRVNEYSRQTPEYGYSQGSAGRSGGASSSGGHGDYSTTGSGQKPSGSNIADSLNVVSRILKASQELKMAMKDRPSSGSGAGKGYPSTSSYGGSQSFGGTTYR